MNRTKSLAGLILIYTILSCSNIEDQEPIPAFIHIDVPQFSSRMDEGTDFQMLPHAWLNIAGDFTGAYEVPTTIPVNYFGEQDVIYTPGVFSNGLSDFFELVETIEPFRSTLNLISGETDTLRAELKYKDNVTFYLNDDFDEGFHSFNENLESEDTRMIIVDSGCREGKCGKITLTSEFPTSVLTTRLFIEDIPLNNQQLILEAEYKNDAILQFGIYFNDEDEMTERVEPLFGVNAKNDWNKLYFFYQDAMNTLQIEDMRVVIFATLPPDTDTAYVYLDNLKLVGE